MGYSRPQPFKVLPSSVIVDPTDTEVYDGIRDLLKPRTRFTINLEALKDAGFSESKIRRLAKGYGVELPRRKPLSERLSKACKRLIDVFWFGK